MRKRKHMALILALALATGLTASPISNVSNVVVVSAAEGSDSVEVAKGNMDKFTATLSYGAGETDDNSDWNNYPLEITKDGEYTFTHTVTKDNSEIKQLSVKTDLYEGSLNENFKIEAESVTVNDKEYSVDKEKAAWNNGSDDATEKPYTYTIINAWGSLNSTKDADGNGIGAVQTGDKITVKIKITGTNNKASDTDDGNDDKTDKGNMDKFTATLSYGAGETEDSSDWNNYPLEITKDGEYTFTHTVTKDNSEIKQLSVKTDLYEGSLNENFKIEAESVIVNDKEYSVDTSKATWSNWSDDNTAKPYTYTIINAWGNLNSTKDADGNGIGAVQTGDKITVKIKITGTNNKASDTDDGNDDDKTDEGNMDKFTATLKYGAGETEDSSEWANYPLEITKDGEYTFTHTVTNANDKILLLSIETNLHDGSLNDGFKIKANSVTVNDTEYSVDTEKATWDNNGNNDKTYTYTLINSWAPFDTVGIGAVKAGDKITVNVKITGTNTKSADIDADEDDGKDDDNTDVGNMDKFKVHMVYGAGSDWADYPLVITKDGEYTLTHTATADVDNINLLTLKTNLYYGHMNSVFKITPETVTVNDDEYTIDKYKAVWNNSGDEDINPYTYILINSWGNLNSTGVGSIHKGDKITVKFIVKGTNSDLERPEINMPITVPERPTVSPSTEPTAAPSEVPSTEPTAEPSEAPTVAPSTEPTAAPSEAPSTEPTTAPSTEPTAEPSTEPTVSPSTEPTAEPTAKPTKKPALKKTTLTIKSGNKNISSVKVKAKKIIKISVSTNSNAKLSISGISKKEAKIAKITFKNGKLIVKGLKKGKVTFKISSKKTSKYKAASKTITVTIG